MCLNLHPPGNFGGTRSQFKTISLVRHIPGCLVVEFLRSFDTYYSFHLDTFSKILQRSPALCTDFESWFLSWRLHLKESHQRHFAQFVHHCCHADSKSFTSFGSPTFRFFDSGKELETEFGRERKVRLLSRQES